MEDENPFENAKKVKMTSEAESFSLKISERTETTTSKLLAYSAHFSSKINLVDLQTMQDYASFTGVQIQTKEKYEYEKYSWTHVKEIPNTELLVSAQHRRDTAANMEIFDVSRRGQANKIYSFEEVKGHVGNGDVAYNPRRNLLGLISVVGETAHHLFNIGYGCSKGGYQVNLVRKAKWPLEQNHRYNVVIGLDFDPTGEKVACFFNRGTCSVSDLTTDNCIFDYSGFKNDYFGRCRWSPNAGDPIVYVKFGMYQLNILNVEKKVPILKNPLNLEKRTCYDDSITFWIDVCPIDGNLLASGGEDHDIKIYDRRESKIVKVFSDLHSERVKCIRWSPYGDLIASAAMDCNIKLTDFKAGKVIHTASTQDQKYGTSVCFI